MASHEMMRAYLDTVTAGKFTEAQGFYSDDVKVHFRGRSAASGEYVGQADYTAAISKLVGLADDFSVEEHDLLVSDDHAVVLSTWKVTKDGQTTDLNHCVVYHTSGDRITEIWIIPEDADAEAALLS